MNVIYIAKIQQTYNKRTFWKTFLMLNFVTLLLFKYLKMQNGKLSKSFQDKSCHKMTLKHHLQLN